MVTKKTSSKVSDHLAGEPLKRYAEKRDFNKTSEPPAATGRHGTTLRYVIQKHWASRLHYDFRLEFDGVLMSWALPKALSFDPKEKRIAIQVEDHPVDYATFEGTIPAKQYGAGSVIVWDQGAWEPIGDVREGLQKGKILFVLHGEKLAGQWELVRISKPADKKQDQWMIFKKKDGWARPLAEYDVISALPDSVIARPLGLVETREAWRNSALQVPEKTRPVPVKAAPKRPMPAQLSPQLATLAKTVPSTSTWVYEIKFDGYRIMARIDNGNVQLITRGGHDWTNKMPAIARDLETLGLKSAWLDGEVVVLNAAGVPDFNALQNAFDRKSTSALTYFVFDAPYLNGYDLRDQRFLTRKDALRQAMAGKVTEHVRFTEHFDGEAGAVLESACKMQLEGVIAKRTDAGYVSDRTTNWLKLKCSARQEFVIAGFVDRQNAKDEVGSLLLAYYNGKTLTYAGNVGTGWSAAESAALHNKLVSLETATPTLDPALMKPGRWSKRSTGNERWVKPVLVGEVAFAEWTPDGHVRHPSFKGLRHDKDARLVVRETTLTQSDGPATPIAKQVKISNPERVIDSSSGATKADLVRYYESIAERMLPHLQDRPVSLLRAPAGITGEQFFQKHDDKLSIPGMRTLDPALWPGHSALLEAGTVAAIVNAAQMNVVEFHTSNSKASNIEHPDRMIFDLDPGEGVTWAHIQEAAILVQAMLAELGLKSWLKTSGGKGLHIDVPLNPVIASDTVKGFSQAVVRHLAKAIPSRFVSKSGASNRIGRIFIDWLRNGARQTTAAAFSARARAGLGVSMPIDWSELDALKRADYWTVKTAREHLSFQRQDPWQDYWHAEQNLEPAMARLGYRAKAG